MYHNILVCGDFNFPKINWESPELTTGVDEVQFTELLNDYHLSQLNTLPTRGNNILDLVITNVPTQVENISVLSPFQNGLITDHSTIAFNLVTFVRASPRIKRLVFDYRKGNFDRVRATLENLDLCSGIESEVDINLFFSAIRNNIPMKKIRNINSPPWINGEIIHAIKRKETVRRKLKSSPTDALRNRFKELRTEVKHLMAESRSRFFEDIGEDLHHNPKRFWSVFKIKSKHASIPDSVTMGCAGSDSAPARSASCPREIAELFNDYFSSIVTDKDNPSINTFSSPPPSDSSICDLILSPEDVLVGLLNLDIHKAVGPDQIPPRLLKECAHQIAPSLSLLFNRSISEGSLPDEWKLANIVPVHKKGEKTDVVNYRPISLLCVVSKVLERCVLSTLKDHLLTLINSTQHGFIPGKSCTTQLVEVLDYIGSLLDGGKQTDIIFMDMSKAFDKPRSITHFFLINFVTTTPVDPFSVGSLHICMVANSVLLHLEQPPPKNQYLLECRREASWDLCFSCCT